LEETILNFDNGLFGLWRTPHGVCGGTGFGHVASPRTELLKGLARTWVIRLGLLKEVQNVFSALRRLQCQQVKIAIKECAATRHGNKTGVAHLAKNH
jgi:hypothetical protein